MSSEFLFYLYIQSKLRHSVCSIVSYALISHPKCSFLVASAYNLSPLASGNMAGGGQLGMPISAHYDGKFLPGCSVRSYPT
jgi:hypothetical protein